jgi:hypothetical protein
MPGRDTASLTENGDAKIIPIYIEALKMVAAGNGAGLFGAGVALYYFANRDACTLWWIKVAGASYLVGVCAFAVSGFFLFSASANYYASGRPLFQDKQLGAAIGFGLLSFIVWWAGTTAAGIALYRL